MSTTTTAGGPKIHTAYGVGDAAAMWAELDDGRTVAAVWHGRGSAVFMLWHDKLVRVEGAGNPETLAAARRAFARFLAELDTAAGAR